MAVRQHPPNTRHKRRRSNPISEFERFMRRYFYIPKLPRTNKTFWIVSGGGLIIMFMMLCLGLIASLGIIYGSGDVLPGVSVAGIDVSGQSVEAATITLENEWQTQGIILEDEGNTWRVEPHQLGITLDAPASAQAAHDYGRADGSIFNGFTALMTDVDIEPVLNIDIAQTRAGLEEIAPLIEQPAMNAGVQVVDGQVVPTAAVQGRILDIEGTLLQIQQNGASLLADGQLELIMVTVEPAILDSTPMVAQAAQLLASPLVIEAYDPVKNTWENWSVAPTDWSTWLTATSDNNQPGGLALTIDSNAVTGYLNGQNNAIQSSGRYIEPDEIVADLQANLAQQNPKGFARIYYHPRQHTVRSGETISSIAYDYGVPYPWVQQANPGIANGLSIGQSITIPSPDDFMPLPIVPNKRIVVSISQQRMWAYENGTIKWEWVVSTGISDSPTWPGIFQIQTHDGTAYAGNWNLWMPSFMGVYRPVPTSEFMNGFHGFPSRNGSQILWTSNLGAPITYGCILLSSTNAELLYDWAEEGVVVEIQK